MNYLGKRSNIFIGGKVFCVPKFIKFSDLPYFFNVVALVLVVGLYEPVDFY